MEAEENLVHQAGEGCKGIAQSKGHLVDFIQLPIASAESCLLLVLLSNCDLPIPALEIESTEPLSAVEASRRSSIRGREWASLVVVASSCQESTQKRRLPSVLTMTTNDAHGLLEGRMTPLSNICCTCVASSLLMARFCHW